MRRIPPWALSLAVLLNAVPLSGQPPFVLASDQGEPMGFATLQGALDAAAMRRQNGDAGDLTIRVRGGVHALQATAVVAPECTAPKGRLTIEAFPGERPVLSGGTRIAQWTAGEANGRAVWTAELGAAAKDVRELWIDGQRRTLARHPDRGTLAVEAVPDADGDWTHGNFGFRFRQGDLDASAVGADLVVMCRWVESHLPVLAVDAGARTVRTSKRSVFRLESGDPWYAEGAAAFLDRPGEFSVDRATGRLAYLPLPGEDPAQVVAFVPRLAQLLRFDGVPAEGRWVDNVTFRGLSFHHAEWWFPADFRSNWPAADAGGFSQAAILVPAAIAATGARSCSFEECELRHLGGYGIEFCGGCTGNTLSRCTLGDLGAGGIKVGTTTVPTAEHDTTGANTIADCDIGDGGHLFHSAVGVWIGQSGGNHLVHNAIHDFLYTGISIGWTWGYGPAHGRGQRVTGNHVHHIGARSGGDGPWLADMAGIYTLGDQTGTVIAGNWFHDVAAFKYGGWGIYFDEGTSRARAERNVVARTTHGGFHQHYGRDNVFDNNVLVLGRDAQVQRTRPEEHESFAFTRNIVAWRQGGLFAGDLRGSRFAFARNVYWRDGGGEIAFAGATIAQWQANGMDPGSLIVDPGFVDAAHDDYRLAADSPALALGIESVDVRGTGPRPRR